MVSNPHNVEITLTPNRSLTTTQTQWVVFGVCTVVFIIALFWSMQGAFFVLPFAGLDIVLFAYFMFKINQESLRKQLITIDDKKVLIQSGKIEIEEAIALERPDTVVVVAPKKNRKSMGLKLSDSKSHFVLGEFLTDHDKKEARKALKEAGLKEMNEQWWQPLN